MKIEKVSDSQIKFILSKVDLENRNIQLKELAYGSEKTQALFREMMEHAVTEYGFVTENTPLMIEAMPESSDSIMIILTKINNPPSTSGGENSADQFRNILADSLKAKRTNRKKGVSGSSNPSEEEGIFIYSFKTLDDVINASVIIYNYYNGTNFLFKEENLYFLIVHNDDPYISVGNEELEMLLAEYGQKHISSELSKYYLFERGEAIIKNSAIQTLAKHFK